MTSMTVCARIASGNMRQGNNHSVRYIRICAFMAGYLVNLLPGHELGLETSGRRKLGKLDCIIYTSISITGHLFPQVLHQGYGPSASLGGASCEHLHAS